MADLSSCIVLIVDDTVTNVDILVETLGDDYDVRVAMDGESALEAVQAELPDLILLDIMMPGMSGYAVCERLKATEYSRAVPIIFISAMGEAESEAKGLALGAVDYISKPFNPQLVKARIKNQLELKLYRDHLEQLVKERTREVELTQAVMIESMATLAEYRDPETGGHVKRTQNYVKALAKQLQDHPAFRAELDDETIELLYISAPLHDVGKVGVPDHILRKEGPLTDAEYAEMKKHPEYGANALRISEQKLGESHFLRCAIEIALTHHERWDGAGYPNGLRKQEIPLAGRLMALADVYDALISKRTYKPPLPHEQAVHYIVEQKGGHFDPEVVEAFIALMETFRNIALTYADFDEEREILARSGQPVLEQNGQVKKVLLVEDNEINLAIMHSQLVSLGFQVDTAVNGRVALPKLKEKDYDLVLTDLDMPEMSGYELTAEIRSRGKSMPILAITASDFDLTKERALALGFDGYMLKPFETDALVKKLESIARKRDG